MSNPINLTPRAGSSDLRHDVCLASSSRRPGLVQRNAASNRLIEAALKVDVLKGVCNDWLTMLSEVCSERQKLQVVKQQVTLRGNDHENRQRLDAEDRHLDSESRRIWKRYEAVKPELVKARNEYCKLRRLSQFQVEFDEDSESVRNFGCGIVESKQASAKSPTAPAVNRDGKQMNESSRPVRGLRIHVDPAGSDRKEALAPERRSNSPVGVVARRNENRVEIRPALLPRLNQAPSAPRPILSAQGVNIGSDVPRRQSARAEDALKIAKNKQEFRKFEQERLELQRYAASQLKRLDVSRLQQSAAMLNREPLRIVRMGDQ